MKKFTAFLIAFIMSGALFAQVSDCSDLIISEYVEGWDNNKALELYNPTHNVITFTDTYRLIRWSNGSTTADQDPLYVLPLVGTIEPLSTVVMIQDTTFPGQDTMIYPGLRAKATYLAPADYNAGTQGCRVVFWNGDDAVSLQKKINSVWVDIDIFAEIGVRPLNWTGGTSPAGAWTDTPPYWRGEGAYLTQNQSLVRKSWVMKGIDRATMLLYGSETTGGFPNSFNALVEYDSLPANTFDSLGHHTCDCEHLAVNDKFRSFEMKVSPNPVTGNRMVVESANPVASVEVSNLPGSVVYRESFVAPSTLTRIEMNGILPSGLYILKVTDREGRTSATKIIVK